MAAYMQYKPPAKDGKAAPSAKHQAALENTRRMFDMLKSGMQVDAASTLKVMG